MISDFRKSNGWRRLLEKGIVLLFRCHCFSHILRVPFNGCRLPARLDKNNDCLWTVHVEDNLGFARVLVQSVHASRSIFSLQIGVTALLTVETEVRDSILAAFRANSPNELNLSSAVDLISSSTIYLVRSFSSPRLAL